MGNALSDPPGDAAIETQGRAPGVRIGHHSVIATGAVVHDDVPPYSLVVGGGYRIARSIEDAVRGAEDGVAPGLSDGAGI